MTREQFKAILDPLVLALRAEVDLPTWTAYFRALEDVPPTLLAAAVSRAAKSATFLPKPGELRTWAEEARQALIAAHPYTGCCDCEDAPGWAAKDFEGVTRMARCPCWRAHQSRLASLGGALVALPAGEMTE